MKNEEMMYCMDDLEIKIPSFVREDSLSFYIGALAPAMPVLIRPFNSPVILP